jgi:uncharacterized spore protein YtfJ
MCSAVVIAHAQIVSKNESKESKGDGKGDSKGASKGESGGGGGGGGGGGSSSNSSALVTSEMVSKYELDARILEKLVYRVRNAESFWFPCTFEWPYD